jgi:hypothetical protein
VHKAELDGGEFFHPGIVEHGLGLTVSLAAGLDEFFNVGFSLNPLSRWFHASIFSWT